MKGGIEGMGLVKWKEKKNREKMARGRKRIKKI